MPLTRSQYITYIKEEFRRTDLDDEIIRAIDDTLYDMTSEFPAQVMQTHSNISLVANTYEYAIPSTMGIIIDGIQYLDANGGGYNLNKKTKSEFDRKWPDLTTLNFIKDEPQDYYIYGDNIVIAPYLENVTNETLRVAGAIFSTGLATDSSTTQFQDRWRETIKRGVLWRMFLLIEDINNYEQNLLLYQRSLQKMKRIDEDKASAMKFVKYQGF